MPTSNFLQWDPALTNAETDTAYAADASRSGGAPVNAIFASALANKLFYQVTTMAAALAGYLNGQGQNAQDGNLATLTANIQAAIAAQFLALLNKIVSIGFSAMPNFDASQGIIFEMTLTGNVTSSTLVNTVAGQRLIFIIHQDATGGRTFAWPANVLSPGVVDPGISNTSVQEFVVDAAGAIRPTTAMTVS